VADYVVDTHALFWYLVDSRRLGATARNLMDEAAAGHGTLVVPSIVVAELYYLNAKLGRPLDFPSELQRLLSAGQFRFVEFQATDVLQFDALSAIPEMHDRMVAAVALSLGIPCLTSDSQIANCDAVETVW